MRIMYIGTRRIGFIRGKKENVNNIKNNNNAFHNEI